MRKKLATAVAVLAVFAMTGIANANLLTNGDFENTNTTSWTHWAWGAGWSEHTVKSPAVGGNDTLLLNVGNAWYNGGGGAYQTVEATAGTTYSLTVDSGAEGWWQPTGEMALIWFDGTGTNEISKSSRYTVDPAVYGTNTFDTLMPMENYELIGLAPAGAEFVKVEFASRMPDGVGGTITFDNAVLEVIPEPATLGLLGLAGMGLWIRRRISR